MNTPRSASLRAVLPGAALLVLFAVSTARAVGPEPVLIWPEGAPAAVGDEDRVKPELRIYLPEGDERTKAGVVVCPGGGYGALAMDHEGHQVARWFNSKGIAAFVLKYRLGPRYRHPAPLQDAQRALRYVRANSEKFKISPERIGIMGFSAGGHLASTAATHFDEGTKDSPDPIARVSSRPDFAILCYPVISMTQKFGHTGSRRNLLGENPDPDIADFLSSEKQVTAATPPTFLFHTGEDAGVPVENSLAFYAAMRAAKVPGELHVFQSGPHGVGLAPGNPALEGWKDLLFNWMKQSGFLAVEKRAVLHGKVSLDGEPVRWGTISLIPENGGHRPTAWALIGRGNFAIPIASGPTLGPHRVEIRTLGSVEPQPTIDNVRLLSPEENGSSELTFDVSEGVNVAEFELKARK